MAYWRLFYHLIWVTRYRAPLLGPQIAREVYSYLVAKAEGLGGTVYAVGGTENHVHLVAAIPPSVSVARFVGQIKGVSSAKANSSGILDGEFRWQESYGAFSFDAKRLPRYIAYVENQLDHHREGEVISILERAEPADEGPKAVRDGQRRYAVEVEELRSELPEM